MKHEQGESKSRRDVRLTLAGIYIERKRKGT